MTLYAREVHTGRTFVVRTRTNQERYGIRVLAPGTYVVFSRASRQGAGTDRDHDSLYSRAVPCGMWLGCLDNRPIPVAVRPGQRQDGVDVCDVASLWTPGLFQRAGGVPAALPGSDARSLQEVKAAWRRLLGLRTYRARVRIPEELAFEVKRQGHSYAVRVARVEQHGGWMRVRVGDHAWESVHARGKSSCLRLRPGEVPLPPSVFPQPGSPAVEEVVAVRRVGDRAEARGARLVSVYEWRSRLAMVRGWQVGGSLHVDRASGLPVWMTFEAEREKFTAEYYDFNAPVRVTKPAGC
jgi:hypothetical protein